MKAFIFILTITMFFTSCVTKNKPVENSETFNKKIFYVKENSPFGKIWSNDTIHWYKVKETKTDSSIIMTLDTIEMVKFPVDSL